MSTLTSRRVINPVLADDPVIEVEGSGESVFYTPLAQKLEEHKLLIIALTAGFCLLTAWIISAAGGPEPLEHLFILVAFASAGTPALSAVWRDIVALRLDIDGLMLMGAVLAAGVGSPFEGALLLFLFALSGGLERYAVGRTHAAIGALRKLAPRYGLLMEGSEIRQVALSEVPVGASILVRPGDRIPLDGVVVEGQSSVNEATITGESMPRDCGPASDVFAGTLNLEGRLVVRVTKVAADSTLARIIRLVTQARQSPPSTQRLIDRIGQPYSLIVVIASALTFLAAFGLMGLSLEGSLRRAIALLIVASPCALLIGTPVAYLAAIAGAARRGVLLKGGTYLEALAHVNTVVFDKTGTLTAGLVRLTHVHPPPGLDEARMLRFAAALEGSSSHPLAQAVARVISEKGIMPPAVTEYRSVAGEGIEGHCEGHRVWIGRVERLVEQSPRALNGLEELVDKLRSEGKTVSAIVVDGQTGLLAFEDILREGAKRSIAELRSQGVQRLEMLTGDHKLVARHVAGQLGLDGYRAELSPEAKVDIARQLRGQGVLAMVGDGVNDAPVLAHADVGIAVASAGADAALEAAHAVLMRDRIELVAWLHRHARRTARVVHQNIGFALIVITALSMFTLTGEVPLPLAVVGHEGSTVLVAINALRLLSAGQAKETARRISRT